MKKVFYAVLVVLIGMNQHLWSMASRPTDPNAPQPPAWTSLVPMVVLFIAFYFFLIRPQSKQRQEKQKLLDNLKRGDQVITLGGLYAQIMNITGDVLEVKLNDETKVKMQKSAVVEVVVDQPEIPTVVNGAK